MLVSGEGNHPQKKKAERFCRPAVGSAFGSTVGLSSRWGEKKLAHGAGGLFVHEQ